MTAPIDKAAESSARRRKVRLVAASFFAAVLVGTLVLRSGETICEGKPAGVWVDELGDNSYLAANALRQLGPAAVRPLIHALERKPAGWLKAYAAVSKHAPRVLRPKLGEIYYHAVWRDSRIPRVRAAAAQMLGDLGPVAARAVPALVNVLADGNAVLRRNAAFAVGKIGARPDLAVPALCALLRDPNEEVRMYAAIALKKFGAQAAPAVPTLVSAVKDRSWQVRERAVLALGTAGRHHPEAVAALEQAMLDEHRFVRSSAATALAWLAPQASTARIALEQARYDPDAEVRYSAAVAVNQIESAARAPAVR
jgi:HEAT repeat protein